MRFHACICIEVQMTMIFLLAHLRNKCQVSGFYSDSMSVIKKGSARNFWTGGYIFVLDKYFTESRITSMSAHFVCMKEAVPRCCWCLDIVNNSLDFH